MVALNSVVLTEDGVERCVVAIHGAVINKNAQNCEGLQRFVSRSEGSDCWWSEPHSDEFDNWPSEPDDDDPEDDDGEVWRAT